MFQLGQLRIAVRGVALDELDRTDEVDELNLLTAIAALRDVRHQQAAHLRDKCLHVRGVHRDVMFGHAVGGDCLGHV